MKDITFISGNQAKADYLSKYLGLKLKHRKLELKELQSLELREVVEHKVRQAYEITKSPVLVEDVSLEFEALGRLPGTFIKFYVDEVPFETICRSLDNLSRNATAKCIFAYYDGQDIKYFESSLSGRVADHPAGNHGYGWDKIFIPIGYQITRAEMDEKDDMDTYLKIKPFKKLKAYLESL